ncbi:MAG: hypothetical protein HQ581_16385, partial [Planctomycetes bacterium]|nr:hypothetical protein [Planctomycetota bacterium]
MNRLRLRIVPLVFWLTTLAAACCAQAERNTGPWDMDGLKTVPEATWGEKTGPVREVYYEG